MFSAEDSLLNYYQLDHDPFAARVPNFKFYPAQRKTILGQLHHLARHSQLMLLITGPKGSGKTLLRQALIASINKETVKIVSVTAKDCPSVNDVLRLLAKELSIQEITVVAVIEQIKILFNKGISFYFMIDDADQLSDDVIQLLLNLVDEQLTGLRIFLFARPSLLDKLDSSVISKEVTFNLPLTPYSLEETKEYLTLRLEGAGQSLAIFSNEQIMYIYTQSGGWPGIINQVAKDCLIENMQMQELTAEPDIDNERVQQRPKRVSTMSKLPLSNRNLAILGIVVVCLVVILFISNKKTPKTEPTTTSVTTIDNQTISSIPAEGEGETTQTIPVPNVSSDEPVNSPTEPANSSANNIPPAPIADEPTKPNASNGVPVADNKTVNTTSKSVTTAISTTNNISNKNEAVGATNTRSETITNKTTKNITSNSNKNTSVTNPKTTPKSASSTRLESTNKTGNAWYKSQQGAHFTIQVAVARNEKAAKEALSKHGSNYRYFKRSRSGKVDYVITYGDFDKRSDAQNAIKKLPAAIQQSKPWVRTFASIRQELAN